MICSKQAVGSLRRSRRSGAAAPTGRLRSAAAARAAVASRPRCRPQVLNTSSADTPAASAERVGPQCSAARLPGPAGHLFAQRHHAATAHLHSGRATFVECTQPVPGHRFHGHIQSGSHTGSPELTAAPGNAAQHRSRRQHTTVLNEQRAGEVTKTTVPWAELHDVAHRHPKRGRGCGTVPRPAAAPNTGPPAAVISAGHNRTVPP